MVFATPLAACQLALVLAIDISNSVDQQEFEIQTEGLADALLDPEVMASLVRGQMAVSVFFWSGPSNQYLVVPWTAMTSEQVVVDTSDKARALRRVYAQSNTSVGGALGFARALFDQGPDCQRRTVDVSGDGQDNASTSPRAERNLAAKKGVTINGLAIDNERGGITRYFRETLITPNGFVMTSRGHESYGETLKRKLRRETAEAMM